MSTQKCSLLLLVICVVSFLGCGMLPGGEASLELRPTPNQKYNVVFENAIKACRKLDLPVNLADKEAGEIECGLKSSEEPLYGNGYSIDVFIDRDSDQAFVKDVNIKVRSRGGAYSLPTTNSDAKATAQRYIEVLRRAGISS